MKLSQVVKLTKGKILCGDEQLESDLGQAFSSDLMSDVLTLGLTDILLITGLVNLQVIRTAEMADIKHVLLVRNKTVSEDIIELAKSSGICLIHSPVSMFKASGELYHAGLKPIY